MALFGGHDDVGFFPNPYVVLLARKTTMGGSSSTPSISCEATSRPSRGSRGMSSNEDFSFDWVDENVLKMFFVYNSPDYVKGMANAIYSRGPWSLEV
ncbi:hypothetical protein CR513_58412, partial [Mucuna pruriens]